MKKGLLSIFILTNIILPLTVSAQSITSIPDIFRVIATDAVWVVFGGIATICFVAAAILFLSSGGNPEKLKQSKTAFLYGVAGVVVGILAYSIIAIVSGLFS